MSDDLRELIARVCNQPTPLQTADAILAALYAAGWTIVKRNTALTAAGDNPHDAPLARAALRVQAVAFQQTPATPNPGSIPAGEADTPSGGDINTQQQGGPVSTPDDLRERIARAMFNADNGAMVSYLEVDEPELMDTDRRIDGTVNFAKLADAVIQELGNVVNEGGAWGVIDLLIEITGPRCTAGEGNRP